jgi:hypothetical protein
MDVTIQPSHKVLVKEGPGLWIEKLKRESEGRRRRGGGIRRRNPIIARRIGGS